ncbi:methyltransferase-like protein 13 isoform X2 [Phalaenopsis equestris]|uniref:methyltransferase-like protein 13 isoform X2 n=1 Tax=Phalaenopsis equestris TaxID=78828 RepID=UPI0009E29C9D|nr:methyltransferase-like protein 13 isoform X2 [Phalaenopsis equestris]
MKSGEAPVDLLETLGDFTSKENWDKFFTLRGAGDSFEWYAEWPSLRDTLLSQLSSIPSSTTSSEATAGLPRILIPGCGNSRVSEHLYDAGFQQITNIDFSKIAVSDMLHRNIRCRPEMRWRVMDMTDMQFADESFDAVLDKGGLDALMEPEVGSELGSKYLKEVKRVVKSGGKYLCITLAESHVLGLLFKLFRFGWKTTIHALPNKPGNKTTFHTFMVVFLKDQLGAVNLIGSSFDQSIVACHTKQTQALVDVIKIENQIRKEYLSSNDLLYSLRDLSLGAKGNLQEIQAGRRFQLILGGEGDSLYSYKTVLLDAKQTVSPFLYNCAVFIVPKIRACEWLFSSEEGQWQIVESSKAARLIMVFLDISHCHATMEAIQKDLSPLIKSLAPAEDYGNYQIPFMMANDGVKQRKIVYQATSQTTGPMIVEDVIYENVAEGNNSDQIPPENKIFRRLVFERSSGLVQSEALLIPSVEAYRRQTNLSSKSKKKGGRKRNGSSVSSDGAKCNMEIDHSSLASSYHSGIISGFSLVSSELQNAVLLQERVKVIVVGLGAGLFPTFLHICLPILDIEVVELDPVVLELAKNYFGFKEDAQLKVHIGDGIKFIQNANINSEIKGSVANGGKNGDMMKIIIVDADSSDLSSGLACPPAGFVEEAFLSSVKDFLSAGGLFVINLVSRSSVIRQMVISRLKAAFDHLFSLELEEDVNEVLFASSTSTCLHENDLRNAVDPLQNLLKVPLPSLLAQAKTIRHLK